MSVCRHRRHAARQEGRVAIADGYRKLNDSWVEVLLNLNAPNDSSKKVMQ
jgi:hypothetical protein